MAVRVASPPDRWPVLATGLARPRLRRDRGRDLQHRRLDATATSMRRSGCRPAARRRPGRSSGTGHHSAGRTTRSPARTSTTSTSSSDSSTATSAATTTARTPSRRSSGSSASTPRPSRFPCSGPVAGGRRPPTRIRRRSTPCLAIRGGRRAAGRAAGPGRGLAKPRRRSTPSRTGRRWAPAARCRGAPAAHRTASPATCAATRAPARPTRPRPSTKRSRSSASPRSIVHLAVSAPVATPSVRLTDVAPDGSVALVEAGDPQPDPPSSHAHPEPLQPGVSRGDPRTAPDRRLSVAAGPPHPGRRWRPRRGRSSGPRPTRPRSTLHRGPADAIPARPPGHPACRRAGRCARAGLQDRAAGPALADGRGLDGAARPAPTPRSGRSTRTSSRVPSRSMSTTAARTILHDGRRLYAAETLDMTACGRRPGARRARRRRRLSMAGARGRPTPGPDGSRSAPTPTSRARRPTST